MPLICEREVWLMLVCVQVEVLLKTSPFRSGGDSVSILDGVDEGMGGTISSFPHPLLTSS